MIPERGAYSRKKSCSDQRTGDGSDSAKLDQIPACGCVSEVSHTPLECGCGCSAHVVFQRFYGGTCDTTHIRLARIELVSGCTSAQWRHPCTARSTDHAKATIESIGARALSFWRCPHSL